MPSSTKTLALPQNARFPFPINRHTLKIYCVQDFPAFITCLYKPRLSVISQKWLLLASCIKQSKVLLWKVTIKTEEPIDVFCFVLKKKRNFLNWRESLKGLCTYLIYTRIWVQSPTSLPSVPWLYYSQYSRAPKPAPLWFWKFGTELDLRGLKIPH